MLLVLTTCESAAVASKLAKALVEQRLAACVNAIDGIAATYRWQNQLEQGTETLLLIKTTVNRYADVEALILAMSSYELPEIIAVPVEQGLAAYLDWVADAVQTNTVKPKEA